MNLSFSLAFRSPKLFSSKCFVHNINKQQDIFSCLFSKLSFSYFRFFFKYLFPIFVWLKFDFILFLFDTNFLICWCVLLKTFWGSWTLSNHCEHSRLLVWHAQFVFARLVMDLILQGLANLRKLNWTLANVQGHAKRLASFQDVYKLARGLQAFWRLVQAMQGFQLAGQNSLFQGGVSYLD